MADNQADQIIQQLKAIRSLILSVLILLAATMFIASFAVNRWNQIQHSQGTTK